MDSQTALLFLDLLRAQDRDKAQTALLNLGVIRKEDAPVLPGQVSIARLRTILTGLCACFRLRKRYKGFRYLGTCKIFCTMGTCPHELYSRFLDCDSEVTTACLSEWNQVQEPESSVADGAQPIAPLRSLREHIPAVPPASALCTLQFLVERAKARAEKRVEATSKKTKAVAAHSAEAKEYCLDSKLQTLLAQGNCLPLKIAVRRVLASWAASQLASLLLFCVFTM